MNLNHIFCVLGFALIISLPVEGAKSFDPSTIINVYPSLEHLRDAGNVPKAEDDCAEDGMCAAASDTKPSWAKPDEEKPVAPPSKPVIPKKHKYPEPKAQTKMQSDDGRQHGMVDYGYGNDGNKPKNWSSFQDMLQLLRKKKH